MRDRKLFVGKCKVSCQHLRALHAANVSRLVARACCKRYTFLKLSNELDARIPVFERQKVAAIVSETHHEVSDSFYVVNTRDGHSTMMEHPKRPNNRLLFRLGQCSAIALFSIMHVDEDRTAQYGKLQLDILLRNACMNSCDSAPQAPLVAQRDCLLLIWR